MNPPLSLPLAGARCGDATTVEVAPPHVAAPAPPLKAPRAGRGVADASIPGKSQLTAHSEHLGNVMSSRGAALQSASLRAAGVPSITEGRGPGGIGGGRSVSVAGPRPRSASASATRSQHRHPTTAIHAPYPHGAGPPEWSGPWDDAALYVGGTRGAVAAPRLTGSSVAGRVPAGRVGPSEGPRPSGALVSFLMRVVVVAVVVPVAVVVVLVEGWVGGGDAGSAGLVQCWGCCVTSCVHIMCAMIL